MESSVHFSVARELRKLSFVAWKSPVRTSEGMSSKRVMSESSPGASSAMSRLRALRSKYPLIAERRMQNKMKPTMQYGADTLSNPMSSSSPNMPSGARHDLHRTSCVPCPAHTSRASGLLSCHGASFLSTKLSSYFDFTLAVLITCVARPFPWKVNSRECSTFPPITSRVIEVAEESITA